MKHTLCLVLLVVACKSSDKAPAPSAKTVEAPAKTVEAPAKTVEAPAKTVPAVACATAAAELEKQLTLANGYGLDLGDPKSQSTIDAAKQAIMGKQIALKDCVFTMQGNDIVSFAASAADKEKDIECAMAGGEEGNEKFRNAAMVIDMEKLKLDVVGTVGEHKGHIKLTGCKITPHE